MGKLDELTVQGREVKCALGKAALSELADLVLRLHLDAAQSQGAVLTHAMLRGYRERSADEQEGMRAACKHVVVALVLLGIIDAPEL
jgi:hypothetical protein